MPLTIDLTAANRRLPAADFADWASAQTLFLSSVMEELKAERHAVAEALGGVGLTVRWFEKFGGRDDPPDVAYTSEVASADIYLGLLGNQYGTIQRGSGFSATHEEYLAARKHGRRISFWARDYAADRQGHARDFLDEVRVFNTTGRFTEADDLVEGVLGRLREIASEDLSPWIKIGDAVFRAETITDAGNELRVQGRVRDASIVDYLRGLGSPQSWSQREVPVTYGSRSGIGRVTEHTAETSSSATQQVTVKVTVKWADGRNSNPTNINGLSAEDLVEAGLLAGLLNETPEALQRMGSYDRLLMTGGFVDTSDPLAPLLDAEIAEGSLEPIARLLLVEHLVGGNKIAAIEEFRLGPLVAGSRRLRLAWRDLPRYTNQAASQRAIEGTKAW